MLRFFAGILLLVFAGLANTTDAHAQNPEHGPLAYLPALAGDYFELDSAEVGRNYHIFIRLPEGYADNPEKRYPVVYLLDGDSLFPMLAPQHLFLTYDEKLPEAIIVGIAFGGFGEVNTRGIDFRSVLDDGSQGRAGQFLAMLQKELIPHIDAHYRSDVTRRVLVGQSRGGSMALYTAWNAPGLFWGHIASNPGREPNDKSLYGMNVPPPAKPQNGWVIVASGSRDRDYLRGTALEWRDTIGARDDLPWRTEFIDIEGGTHAASIHLVYRQAMLMMFADDIAAALPAENR